MPRYFYHVEDGFSTIDTEGTELTDIYEAQAEAIRLTGELFREMGGKFWDTHWRLRATDETGRVLFTLQFSMEEGIDPDGT